MRPTFGRDYIQNEFQQIADGLSVSLKMYLIGGGAISLRALKAATKDIYNKLIANKPVPTDGIEEDSEPTGNPNPDN